MARLAALDLAPQEIRVNSVHPGPIDMEMLAVRTPEQNAERLTRVPMARMGTADEVAKRVLFLLSNESGYITGAEVASAGCTNDVRIFVQVGILGYCCLADGRMCPTVASDAGGSRPDRNGYRDAPPCLRPDPGGDGSVGG